MTDRNGGTLLVPLALTINEVCHEKLLRDMEGSRVC